MWNVKARVIPVIIGATRTVSTSFRKYVNNIPGDQFSFSEDLWFYLFVDSS
jgi:hypothetical protein